MLTDGIRSLSGRRTLRGLLRGSREKHVLGWCVVALLAAVVLLAPAFANGFPLVFADTGGYLARGFERTLLMGRSAFYGAFLAAGIRLEFWPNILAQACATLWVLALVLRTHGVRGGPWSLLCAVIALALLTSLPWYVSQLMPDIFLPLGVLALYLLAFREEHLSRVEGLGLVGLIAVALASHMGILATSILLVAAFAGVLVLARKLPFRRPALAWPVLALGAGALLALTSNFIIAGKFAFTPGGTHFAFGRLVQDGIIARYLGDRCPDGRIRLCTYRSEIPDSADGWLWGWDSPFYKLGGPERYEPEARHIVLETVWMYPGQHIVTAAKATWEQLLMFRTGEGMHSRDNEHVVRDFARLAPQLMPRFMASLQQQDRFEFTWLNRLHLPVGFLAMALLPILLLRRRGQASTEIAPLAGTVLLVILINAAISGIFSNPNDRYGSRIMWLAPLVVCIAVLQRLAPPALPRDGALGPEFRSV